MAAAESLTRTVVRSVLWVGLNQWGTRVVSLVVFALLGRLLDPEDFGLVALAAVFTAVLGVFVDGGFAQVLVQRDKVSSLEVSTAFWTSVALSLVMYAALAAAAAPLAVAFDQPRLELVLYVLGLQLPITALTSVPAALLERSFAFRVLTMRQLSGISVGAIGGVVAALAGLGVWALVIQTLGGLSVSCAVLWFASDWRPSLQFSFATLRELWTLGVYILGIEAVNLTNNQADKLLVGILLGPTALGYYYIGSRIIQLVSDSLTFVIAQVSLTTFAKLQHEPARFVRAFLRATRTSALVALPVFGALAVIAPALVPLVFGEKWAASVVVMQLLAPMAALNSILYFDKSALIARGFGRDTFLLTLVSTIGGLALMVAATPLGANGIAASRTARQFVFWPVRMWLLRRRIGLGIGAYLAQLVRPALVALVTMAAVALVQVALPDSDLLRVLVAAAAGAVALAASVLLLLRQDVSDVLGAVRGRRAPTAVRVEA